ncbi:MAG: isochorismate synthase [Bacteroidota bacterium]
MNTLLVKVREHHALGLPFVLYGLPESDEIVALFQNDQRTYATRDYAEDGFVLAPFVSADPIIIPEKHSERVVIPYSEKIERQSLIPASKDSREKQDYLSLVSKARKSILEGTHSKIVTSRRKSVGLSHFNLSELVLRLFGLYPNAFRYVWFHPQSGFWCGATPEVLLKTRGKEFSTMALAGTSRFSEDEKPSWTQKEIDEQKWVVDAIADKLQSAASVVRVSKLKNHRAGSLVHLRTDFTGIFKKNGNNLTALVHSLHPTPAVCGTPEKRAKQFIIQNENYDRTYYTGFLGPIKALTNEATLFVNLRCLQIVNNEANLFVGGGITADSVPDAEWKETQNKLQTMLQVIAPMLSNID